MKIFLITVFFILLVGCNKKKDTHFFEDSLYSALLNYQGKNPLPKGNLYKLFIYKIVFSQQEDTLISISVSPTGIDSKNVYGIYKDEILKPTYVVDSKYLSKRFIRLYKKEGIDSYFLKGEPANIDLIYPVYKYKVKDKKLVLLDSLR